MAKAKKNTKKKAPAKAAAKKTKTKVVAKTKKAAPKKAGAKRKPNPAFMKPLTPSTSLAAVVGNSPMPRTQVVKKIWDYIKANDLQDPKNKRNIKTDAKLSAIFDNKKVITMFEMAKYLSKHLS